MTEKKYKGAVFFDIDGTLVDERLGISMPTESTMTAISALKKNGYLTGIATGRAKCYVPKMGIDFDCYVTCNGAVTEINDKVISVEYIEPAKLARIVEYLEKNRFGYDIETRNICYYGEETYQSLFEMMKKFSIDSSCFAPLKKIDDIYANKAMVTFESDDDFDRLCKEFANDFLITRHHMNNSADVSIFGVTKAKGIEKIAKAAGIDIADTYAFGDDANDIEMLSAVGCGIAMTPHSPSLDGVAKKITGGVADDGIYNALCELGLI